MDLLDRTPPKADYRISYGTDALQFGELWIPKGIPAATRTPAPVLVMVHGGWWQAAYDLSYCGFLCEALKALGIAVWSLEYRRVGNAGGGWPGTMQDVAAGFDFLSILAKSYPIDLQRVAAAGHSAGGQLAFWLAGRHHVPPESPLYAPQPKIALRGLVGLAGAVDLRLTIELSGAYEFTSGGPCAIALMGGMPEQVPERYAAADPGELLPLGVPQTLVQGTEDDQIPPALPNRYADKARRQGDTVAVHIVRGADHFDVVDPESAVWPVSRDALLHALRG
jgi:acetyl esterase/lipase